MYPSICSVEPIDSVYRVHWKGWVDRTWLYDLSKIERRTKRTRV